jgi:hypothetical protein
VRTEENVQKARAVPAQDGAAASQGLKGVRKAARERKQERFTTLLHHLTADLLRDSFHALKRDAAPGVDGVRWAEYEEGLEPRLRDLCERVQREKVAKGKVMAIGYADDLVVGFERRDEAERFLKEFGERLAKFGLELHAEKTRLIEFGANAARERGARGEGKPESFTFLGMAHSCDTTRQGRFKIRRQTARKRLEAKLQKIKQTLRSRMHEPVPKVGEWLKRVLDGHYQYFGVPGNWASLGLFRERIARYWGRFLRRRSQKGKVSAIRLGRLFTRWLPRPRVVHPYPEQRFAATHPR